MADSLATMLLHSGGARKLDVQCAAHKLLYKRRAVDTAPCRAAVAVACANPVFAFFTERGCERRRPGMDGRRYFGGGTKLNRTNPGVALCASIPLRSSRLIFRIR